MFPTIKNPEKKANPPTGKLTRETMLNIDYEESSGTASALVNSVAKYYGFYMAYLMNPLELRIMLRSNL